MKAAEEQPRFACIPFRGGWQEMHARSQALLTSVETSERWMSPTVCVYRAANSSPMASMSSSVISGLMLLTVRVAYFVAPVAVAPFSTLILRVVVTLMRCVAIRHPPFAGLSSPNTWTVGIEPRLPAAGACSGQPYSSGQAAGKQVGRFSWEGKPCLDFIIRS